MDKRDKDRHDKDIMKLAVVCHMYPYKSLGLSGGELYMHNTIKQLDIETQVYVLKIDTCPECWRDRPMTWERDGVSVKKISSIDELPMDYDYYITHLDCTNPVAKFCYDNKKKMIFVSHNLIRYDSVLALNQMGLCKIIVNSHNMSMNELYFGKNNLFIWTPPLDYEFFSNCSPGVGLTFYNKYITLINPTPSKGGYVFKNLIELMPHRKFLVVQGGYYIDRQMSFDYPNVLTLTAQTDMRTVYMNTRILLYPSDIETYGMCAQEAQSCGIPVIAYHCNDTLGLVENLGTSGIYIYNNRDDYPLWIREINKLDDFYEYSKKSMQSRQNAMNKNTKTRIEKLKSFIRN